MRVRAEIVALYACSLAAVLLVRSAVLSADAGIPYFAYSTDVTVNLDGWQVDDEGIVTEEAGVVTGISGIPGAPQADLDAMHENDDGSILLVSVDSTVTLPCPPGPMTFGPGDVINFLTCLTAFSADDLGLSGVDVDAVSMIEDDLLLSFDVSVTLGSVEADDEDLVRWLYPGAALFFDGSAAGVPPELDLNAAHLLRNGHLLLSFDGSGTVGGIDFDDEDILEYDPAGSTWQLAWDGSARHPNELPPADIDALVVFEPSLTVTPTDTQTATRTRTATPTRTATGTATPTRTATRTATSTGTATSTRTGTPSWTGTGTASPTRSATPTVTGTGTSTRTGTHTATATHTVAGTQPPTATLTASYTRTPTPSPTQTATATQGVGASYCRLPALSIPDREPTGVTDSLVIGDTETIADLVVEVKITHTYVSDLIVVLTHTESGDSVTLIDRPLVPGTQTGCQYDDIDVALSDDASEPVEDECATTSPAISGVLRPNGSLSTFDGQSIAGTWELTVSDNLGDDVGTLDEWCLAALFMPAPSATSTETLTSVPTDTPTESPTPTVTGTATSSLTPTLPVTPSPTQTHTESATPTSTLTRTATETITPGGPTLTPTGTATISATPAETATVGSPTPPPCAGDCNGGGTVTIDELLRGVNVALGNLAVEVCQAVDRNGDGGVTINELILAVNSALAGCS